MELPLEDISCAWPRSISGIATVGWQILRKLWRNDPEVAVPPHLGFLAFPVVQLGLKAEDHNVSVSL